MRRTHNKAANIVILQCICKTCFYILDVVHIMQKEKSTLLSSSDPESQPKLVQDHWREECKRAPELSPAFPTEPVAVEVIAVSLLREMK